MRKVYLPLFFLLAIFLTSCATTQKYAGQAAVKNFQTREVDASYDQVFNAITEAFLDGGYRITNTEKASGIITAEKNADYTWLGETYPEALGLALRYALNVDMYGPNLIYNFTVIPNVKVSPIDEKTSKIRVAVYSTRPSWAWTPAKLKMVIDRFWVAVQREVMMEAPLEINKTLKNNSVIVPQVKDSTPTWIVNLETYKYKEDAYKRANILKEKGYKVIVRKVAIEGVEISQKETWYRISIVGFKNKQDAYKKIEDAKKYSPSAWIEKSQ